MEKTLSKPFTVREFQQMFEHIYGDKNRELYKDKDLLLRLFEEVGDLMELVRKDQRHLFVSQMANIYSWHNGFANRMVVDLQDGLWWKYPDICTYCLKERDCCCGIEHPVLVNEEERQETIRRYRRERIVREKKSLFNHQELHRRLYGWRNENTVLPYVLAAHITEEVKEVSTAFRHKDTQLLIEELADVASWLFALAIRLGVNFAEEVWKVYPYECRDCHRDKCQCKKKN